MYTHYLVRVHIGKVQKQKMYSFLLQKHKWLEILIEHGGLSQYTFK